jgi:HK97 family phage major capsid protein
MRATDQMLARYVGEIEERQKFIDGMVEDAEKDQRDLTPQEMELVTRARDRIGVCNEQMQPLEESRRISTESNDRLASLAKYMGERETPAADVQYRSAGDYVLDYWRAGLGVEESSRRLELFHRAAAHQTTADNPGLLPEQILAPIISFIDASRPVVTAFGPRHLPSGAWARPKITQHVNVAPQVGEKTELVSRKMNITKIPVTAQTFGGYVNVSRQDIDWTQPAIMDLVIADLAAVYSRETEKAFCAALDAATTPGGTFVGASATPAEIAGVIWAAVGASYVTMQGAGRTLILVSPDMLAAVGPLFPPYNPLNSQSPGFSAGDYASGVQGSISGIPVIASAGFDAGTMIIANTAAAEVYEDRLGSLQVVEPSVLGVQVAYAGYFADLIIETTGLIEVTKT